MKARAPKGFSLIEMALVLVVLSLLTTAAVTAVKRQLTQSSYQSTGSSLQQAQQALIGYLRVKRQLPCPDSNGDGIGDCGARFGVLPYKDLGLGSIPVDGNKMPLWYLAHGNLLTPVANQYTLCQSLLALSRSSITSELYSDTLTPLAFAVVSQGNRDMRDNNSLLDVAAVNPAVGTGYQFKLLGGFGYDDRYLSRSFYSLLGELNCPATLLALNSMENELVAANTLQEALVLIKANIEDQISGAETEILLASFAIVAAAGDVAGAAATMIDATGQVTFFGNGPAMVAAASAVAGAAAGVVAAVEASMIISDAKSSIADFNVTLGEIAKLEAHVKASCSKLKSELISAKGGAKTCN